MSVAIVYVDELVDVLNIPLKNQSADGFVGPCRRAQSSLEDLHLFLETLKENIQK